MFPPGNPFPYSETVFPLGRFGQTPNGANAGNNWVGIKALAWVKMAPVKTASSEVGASAWMFCEMKQPSVAGSVKEAALKAPPEMSPRSTPVKVLTPLVFPPTLHVDG